MKTAVLTDSGSGISNEEAKALGIYIIPMPFTIDGKEYESGVNLTTGQFYKMLENDCDITTSQPSPGKTTAMYDRLLQEYDSILHIPMSSGLSGTCQTARLLAEDYKGRVVVADLVRISVTQRQACIDALELLSQGHTAEETCQILEKNRMEASIYITLSTLKYLKKGGRITPAAAALGTLLRIKPVLQIQGEKLDAFSKARTEKQAKAVMLAAVARDLSDRFEDPAAVKTHIAVAHTDNLAEALAFAEEIRELYPETGDIHVAELALNIACHIGQGSLAVALSGGSHE